LQHFYTTFKVYQTFSQQSSHSNSKYSPYWICWR